MATVAVFSLNQCAGLYVSAVWCAQCGWGFYVGPHLRGVRPFGPHICVVCRQEIAHGER